MDREGDHRTGVGLDHWGAQFPETRWTMLITRQDQASGPSRDRRLADLCGCYWYPLYAYLRRKGYATEDAQDLTQGFFAYLLAGGRIEGLKPELGKFRSYLLGAMKHFLNDRRKYENAQKRGGGEVPFSIEGEIAENRLQNEPVDGLSAEKIFDRKWALTVINETRDRIGREFREQGRSQVFDEVAVFLTSTPEQGVYPGIAEKLGLKEDNVRAIVSRMRKRFKVLLREQVRVTVSSDDEVDGELRYLLGAFS